jgi:hypothetical protein
MATLITSVAAIATAETGDLVFTYNQLTGKSIKKFETRAIGERRVEMAILAAKDADGKTGIPKGAEPQPKTREQIEEKAAARGIEPPPALDAEPVFEPGTLAYELNKAAKAAKPIQERPKKAAGDGASAAKKAPLHAVVATFTGTSKPQAGSTRNAVLIRIQSMARSAATIEALDKHFEQSTKGYIQKLIEKGHLRPVTPEEYAQLPDPHPSKPSTAQ